MRIAHLRGYAFKSLHIIGVFSLMMVSQVAVCGESAWYRYENTYFVANSNASTKKTLAILTELEMFRVAVFQVAGLRVPESAMKTELLILRNKREFEDLERGRNIVAYVVRYKGRFLIVMSASFYKTRAMETVRHEYSHVLLGHQDFDYPQWYDEGFAKLVSTIEFRENNSAFTFGEPPTGVQFASVTGFDWNKLISEGWNNRSLGSLRVCSAYGQSWLLAHYVMLGDDFGNTPMLYRYFQLMQAGRPSLPAFEEAFGLDANELWRLKLMQYNQNLFALLYDFQPGDLQTEFQRSHADTQSVFSLLDELRKYNTDHPR